MEQRLVIVLVLYKKSLSDCPSYNALYYAVSKRKNMHLVVYDNSLEEHGDVLYKNNQVHYIHNPANPGLATAYNEGLSLFQKLSAQLMLLLDQDTEIDFSYLDKITSRTDGESVGAFVPLVYSGNQRISPVFSDNYVGGGLSFPELGKTSHRLMAVNSGTVLTASGLAAIERFNEEFPLDFLDHWLFWKLYQEKQEIEVLDVTLAHDLSVLDYSQVSLTRYESIITAERRFYQNYDTSMLTVHKKHLLKRMIKQLLTVKNRKIWRRTWQEYRLLARVGQ
ncbi:glycosyltransferase [uncultured Enterococcus sp.]|uniref:glycosyltransferase n=1 Tax=uncultured Enterococcus sp. TaxID=167972 RepID=UPI002AA667FD|nr:glycosyltransferase [uncultured Enterococcus sp.]